MLYLPTWTIYLQNYLEGQIQNIQALWSPAPECGGAGELAPDIPHPLVSSSSPWICPTP